MVMLIRSLPFCSGPIKNENDFIEKNNVEIYKVDKRDSVLVLPLTLAATKVIDMKGGPNDWNSDK